MTTSKGKRDPGSGLTPLLGEQLAYAETGQPVPKSESEPPRRRRTRLAAQPVPPPASIKALADQIEHAYYPPDVYREPLTKLDDPQEVDLMQMAKAVGLDISKLMPQQPDATDR
jgi:hypothetical protein